ncbi:hypothetical protein GQ44DRAFT_712607 [Phaeosphaeriaceae sp. PMI808]|nr:hypothetical protein GQ44DRAFT_712607 [Phaeosphaeriaceae sp. PMI808]
MVDTRDAAHEAAGKSRSRWRTKIFAKDKDKDRDEAPSKASTSKTGQQHNDDDDNVNDFLKPSTERAQQQKDAATAAFLATGNRPRIDVARAQRWPGAQDVLNSAVASARSPGPGGLKTGTRKKGLSVAFVRTLPLVIGHGGDECEEPVVEVSRRKQHSHGSGNENENGNHVPQQQQQQQQHPQDDANVGTGMGRTPSQTEQRNTLTRTLTSHGEMSPPLGKKLEMGHINSHAQPPPPLPQRMGPMGLGDRPRPLARTPTGFDAAQLDTNPSRPSMDSVYSQDSDTTSPILTRTISQVEPTIQEEEEDFRPKPLSRTPTGFHTQAQDPPNEPAMPAAPMPRLPEMRLVAQEEQSPFDNAAPLPDHFLQSEPEQPDSFSARVKQRMRAEEGKALHEAAQRQAAEHDSDSSLQSLESQGPQRSRARGLSPARKVMPSSAISLKTDMSPPSRGSPQHSSAASRTHASPLARADPFAAGSQTSVPPPPQFEQAATHVSPSQPNLQTYPSQAQDPRMQPPVAGAQIPMRLRQEVGERGPSSLGRSDTRTVGETAFKEFTERVTHMRGIFELTAQLGGHLYNHTPLQWVRVATWWFLKGRVGMESLIRSRPKSVEPQPERLAQPHVDLAKVMWILTEVLSRHPGLQQYGDRISDAQADQARQMGDALSTEVFEIRGSIMYYMKMLVGSMKKHQSMPPTQALIQGQDQSIWTEYPQFAPDAASVLQAGAPRSSSSGGTQQPYSLSQYIPLADTKTDFCYFRMFAKASMSTDDPITDRAPMPAVVSILRPKDQYQVKLVICSQNDLINIILGSSAGGGPTWDDVNWKKASLQISINLRHGFTLNLELSETDWRSLFSIVDHTNRVQIDLRGRKDERFACKLQLREASYRDPANPAAFPQERVANCKLMVFEKIELSSEGTGKRKLHRGYRLAVATPQLIKQVSIINHELGTKQALMNFEYVTEADQAPALKLHFREEAPDKKPRTCTLHLVFQEGQDRNHLFGTFTSMNIAQGEMAFAQVPLKSFHIESADQAEGFSQKSGRVLDTLQWQEAKVINQDPEAAGLESAPTVMSESLRIVCRHSTGIIADRMNLGPGELLVRLPIDGAPELTLLRNAQQDMTLAIDGSRTESGTPDTLADLVKTLTATTTVRKLLFNSFKDLHAFQFAVTGFDVKFDGIAATFSISRRRMVVPIYKQWTANTIRIQIVEQDNILQLLAFFEDFSHADAMNFQLRSMDTFEKSDKGGKFGLKLVDAKFALPVEERRGEGKMQKEVGRLTGWAGIKRKFVCLDEIEYPGEHDDILIQFESAETRDTFAAALPAVTMERKFTVRRKI